MSEPELGEFAVGVEDSGESDSSGEVHWVLACGRPLLMPFSPQPAVAPSDASEASGVVEGQEHEEEEGPVEEEEEEEEEEAYDDEGELRWAPFGGEL